MNILIIYTYPNHQSFNDAILKVVQQNLSKGPQCEHLGFI